MAGKSAQPSVWITLVWIVAVVFLATAMPNAEGRLAVSVLLGLAVGEVFRLRSRLRALEERLRFQESRAQAVPPPAAAAPASAAAAPAAPPPAAAVARAAPAAAIAPPPPAAPPLPRPAMVKPPAAPPGAFDRWRDDAVAWLRRGNPLARAGVVILFFGGSFLAKYAADHSMFPLELRLLALAAGALALLGVGWRLRGRRPLYAQTLQGGGIAGFYLTVFAATRLYHLLPAGLALALMTAVAVAAALLAVAQDALALAVIGTGGGFLAPILLSTGGGSLVALLSYYTVLNLGVFTVAWFRAWRVLNLVGFVFTFGIAGLFRATAYRPEQQFTMDFFVLLFFLLYFAVSILFSLRQKPELKGYVSGSLVFGLPLVAFALHGGLVAHTEYALAWSALGFGTFYLAAAWALLRSRADSLRLLAEAFGALGVIFASLAVPLAFDRQTTAATWAVEGAGLVWLGIRQERRLARAFGAALQIVGGAGLLLDAQRFDAARAVLNSAFIGSVMLAVAGLLSGWWLFRGRPSQAAHEQNWDSAFALWGLAWWLGAGIGELNRWAAPYDLGGALAHAALAVFALQWAGSRLSWPLLPRIAAGLLPLAAGCGLLSAADLQHPLAHAAWLGWPLLLAANYRLLFRLEGSGDPPLRQASTWLHAGGVWLTALLLAWEAAWRIHGAVAGVWQFLPWGVVPAAFLWLLSRPKPWPAWPLAAHLPAYRLQAAMPLALAGALWVAVVNLGSDGDPAELPYLPLLNPLDVAVALTLAALALYWKALEPAQRQRIAPRDPRLLPAAAAGLTFLWLNAALIRALHYYAGVPLNAAALGHSTLVQAALSIFWGLLGFAAMTLAARHRQRDVWIVGAGLMAAVVIKLFLVDTAGRGTLARIASFLTVGGLLLVTGYLSPLPPRKHEPGDGP